MVDFYILISHTSQSLFFADADEVHPIGFEHGFLYQIRSGASVKDTTYSTHTLRHQPIANGYHVVPFIEQVYLVGMLKVPIFCILFLGRSLFSCWYLSTKRDLLFAFLHSCGDMVLVIFLSFLFLGPSSVLSLLLFERNSIIV